MNHPPMYGEQDFTLQVVPLGTLGALAPPPEKGPICRSLHGTLGLACERAHEIQDGLIAGAQFVDTNPEVARTLRNILLAVDDTGLQIYNIRELLYVGMILGAKLQANSPLPL